MNDKEKCRSSGEDQGPPHISYDQISILTPMQSATVNRSCERQSNTKGSGQPGTMVVGKEPDFYWFSYGQLLLPPLKTLPNHFIFLFPENVAIFSCSRTRSPTEQWPLCLIRQIWKDCFYLKSLHIFWKKRFLKKWYLKVQNTLKRLFIIWL